MNTLEEIAWLKGRLNERESDYRILESRLTTAEQEREVLDAALEMAWTKGQEQVERAAAAEARVEALQPLIEAARLVEALDDSGGQDWWNAHQKLYDALARAALACPPQQRGE